MATSNEELSPRNMRLSDVRRGTHNWRALDVMAASQWTAHADFYARRIPHLTSQSCDLSPSWQRGRLSLDIDVTSSAEPPSYVISDVDLNDDEDYDGYPTYRRLPMVETGHLPRPDRRYRLRDREEEDVEDAPVNTWGSREAEIEAKLVPEPLPRIIRPRQPIVMSRVGAQQGKQLRTKTDFRSRNGTVRVIEPLESSPRLATLSRPLLEGPDPEQVERETTYVMLRRIDKILHPERVFARAGRSSSELEVIGSESTSLTEVLGTPESDLELLFPRQHGGHVLLLANDSRRPEEHKRQKKSRDGSRGRNLKGFSTKPGLAPLSSQPAPPLASRRGGNGVDVPAHQRHQHARPELKVIPTTNASLTPLVEELDKKELDSYQKCQYWIDKWLIVN